MPSDPVVIISGGEELGPSNPVRIANWTEFIAAVAAAIGATPTLSPDQINFNTAATAPSFANGRLFWDTVDNTLAIMQGGDVTQQIGQEQNIYYRNDTGAPITNGQALYLSGSVGYRPTLALARADAIPTASVIAVATQNVAVNGLGFATTFGLVRQLDTQTPGWNEGDRLYLSSTVAGALQTTVPTSGMAIRIGRVLRKHPSEGMIFIFPEQAPFFGCFTAGNYTQFEFDGTMVAYGLATCYRDELQSLASATLVSPAGDFELVQAEAAIRAEISARYPTDYVVTNHQLNHDWKLGTNIFPHLHWWQTTANTPNWLIAHRWQKQGSVKTTAWTNVPWAANAFVWSAGELNQITGFGPIVPPVGYGQVSDIVQFRIYRDYTNVSGLFGGADPVAADQLMVNFDTHIQVDTLGSRQEYIK